MTMHKSLYPTDENDYILFYSHLQHHNDTIIKQTQGQRRSDKMKEDFFNNTFTCHFIARVRKGCSRFSM